MTVILLILLLMLLQYLWSARWVCETPFDETHYVPVAGGRHVALHRLRPRGDAPRKHPVLLCHGLGANRYNLALPGKHSIAERLSREGYDVFCVELTGFGMSVPQSWSFPGRYQVTFDDYVDRDGPAVIERVLRETGAEDLFWVGHSMGGLLAYVLACGPMAGKIRGAVAISSPATFQGVNAFSNWRKLAPVLKIIPRLNLGLYTRLVSTILPVLPRRLFKAIINSENVDMETYRRACANSLSTISSTLLLQFVEWQRHGRIASSNGRNYQEELKTVDRPFLIISGGGDLLVPPSSVEFAYKTLAGPDKTYHCFSKAAGGRADYGHGDIIFGRHVPDEVHPMIVQWIGARD